MHIELRETHPTMACLVAPRACVKKLAADFEHVGGKIDSRRRLFLARYFHAINCQRQSLSSHFQDTFNVVTRTDDIAKANNLIASITAAGLDIA